MSQTPAISSHDFCPRPPRWRRWTKRFLRIAAILYLAACLIIDLIQNRIIFPGAYFQDRSAAQIQPTPDRQVLALRIAQGQRVAAIFGPALNSDGSDHTNAAQCPTILYFYGNGDCIATSLDQFDDFRRLGVNVLIPEFVGYPMSAGKPSEAGLYATADAAYAWLTTSPQVNRNRIVIVGRSLGAAAAIDLASRRPAAGLVTISAFTTMNAMARKVLPIFPTGLLLKSHFDNIDKIARVKCPILLIHGAADDFVPHAMMAELAARAGGPVKTLTVPGAGHNDIFLVGGAKLVSRLGEFANTTR